jgi:hypothetical protein
MTVFRGALIVGAGAIAGLAVAGLFPLALVTAAVLVPLVVLLYFWSVDLYEDEPVRVLALTIAWGAATGVGFGFLAKAVQNHDAGLVSTTVAHSVAWNGILLPLIGFTLAIAGPLVLLPYRKFNDVLDGVTFGGASAVVFAGAALFVRSATFLGSGLEPVGSTTPWVLRVLTLGIVVPTLAAAAIGAAAGSLWLRYRAPARDRKALGPLGHPIAALALAASALVGAGLLQLYLNRWAAFAALVALDGVALVWLRQVIHVGLLEEAAEREIGPPVRCANCGRTTPCHTFCAHCGIALAALPKTTLHRPVHLLFASLLGLAVAVALATILLVRPGPTKPFCAGKPHCAGPPSPAVLPSGAPALVTGRVWSTPLGFRLEYDPAAWSASTASSSGSYSVLFTSIGHIANTDLKIFFLARPATGTSIGDTIQSEKSYFQTIYPALATDTPANQMLDPSIGSKYGVGEADAGTTADESNPVEVVLEAARADGVDVVAAAWTDNPRGVPGSDSPYPIFVLVDQILETARWPSERTP